LSLDRRPAAPRTVRDGARPRVRIAPVTGGDHGRPRLTLGERLRDLLLVAFAFLLGGTLLTGYATLRIWQVGQEDGRRPVDAIVVLGAAQYNGRPSGALAARLDHAIELYKAGVAPYLITTGGNLPGDNYTEAQTGFNYAAKRGVPASAILMEDTGRTTLESIQHVKTIFDAHGFHTALFVSDRSHMLRVLRQAQDQGIEAWSSPTETSPDDLDSTLAFKSLIHELGGMGLYVFVNEDVDSGGGAAPTPTASAPASSASAPASTAS
jgi:uncharacterized SAM-binding protein YcdF (DUF218 family)